MESPDDDGGGEYACLASNAYAAAMAKYDRLARRYNVAMRSHKVMQIIETDTQKALDPLGDAVEVLQRTAVQQDGRILLTRLQAAEVVDGFPMVKEAVGPLMVPTDEEMKMMEEAMLHNLYTKPQAIVLGPGLCQPPSTRTFENFYQPEPPEPPTLDELLATCDGLVDAAHRERTWTLAYLAALKIGKLGKTPAKDPRRRELLYLRTLLILAAMEHYN